MKSQPEYNADQLEELLSSRLGPIIPSTALRTSSSPDAEQQELVILAQQLRTAPALQPDPAFAHRLERKVLAHNGRQTHKHTFANTWPWLFIGHGAQFRVIIVLIILCLFGGTSTALAMASTTNPGPDNPLYMVKTWKQNLQLSLADSPQSRATINLQITRDQLNTMIHLADPTHANAYHQTMVDLEQQIDTITPDINALPPEPDRQHLLNELIALKDNIRHTLYTLLPKLPFPEKLATTTFLAHLGAAVPIIQKVTVTTTKHPTLQVTISVTGTNLANTTRLLVNNQPVTETCTFQSNTCLFVAPMSKLNQLSTISIINTDDTAAQTSVITHATTNDSNGNNQKTDNKKPNSGNNTANNTNNNEKGNEKNNVKAYKKVNGKDNDKINDKINGKGNKNDNVKVNKKDNGKGNKKDNGKGNGKSNGKSNGKGNGKK